MKTFYLILLAINFLLTSCSPGEEDRTKTHGKISRSKVVIPDPSAIIQGSTSRVLYASTQGIGHTAIGQLFTIPLGHEYLTKVGFYLLQSSVWKKDKTDLKIILRISKWDGKKPENEILWLSFPVIIEKHFKSGWVYFDITHLKLDPKSTYVAWLSLAEQNNPVSSSIEIGQMSRRTSTPPPKGNDHSSWQPTEWEMDYPQGNMVMCVKPELMQSMDPLTPWRQEPVGVNTSFTMSFENVGLDPAALNENSTSSTSLVDLNTSSSLKLEKHTESQPEPEVDKQESMKSRIAILLNAPPQKFLQIKEISIPYSAETRDVPSVPIALSVASSSPVAAVTFKNGFVEIFDLARGRLLSRIQTSDDVLKPGHQDFYLSPNGRIFVSYAHWPKSWVKLWDTQTGEFLREENKILYPRPPISIGGYFVFANRRKIGVFDLATGDEVWSIEGKEHAIFLGVSPDDKWLIFLRGNSIECWELSYTGDKKISFTLRSSEVVGNFKKQPNSIAFAQDNNSFYGTLPDEPVILQWRMPDLKILRKMRFPTFSNMKLIQGPHDNSFLLTGMSSDKILKKFSVDMVNETAHLLVEHNDDNDRILSLWNSQLLSATPFDLKINNLPKPTTFLPFSQVLGGIIADPITSQSTNSESFQVDETSKVNCEDFQLEAIGVYEGKQPNGKKRRFGEKTPGHVSVKIGTTDKPTKLVLCSYEPVIWHLQASSGTIISEVFLSGSNESEIEGLRRMQITYIGSAFAYENNKTSNLAGLITKQIGCGINRFQGAYYGDHFSIGEIVLDASLEKSRSDKQDFSNPQRINNFYKRTDEKGKLIYHN
jgi:hypothetical protein